MPIHDYRCDHCGHAFSAVQSFTDSALERCPNCGKRPRKLMASPALVFKGSGWYKTDSRSAKSKKEEAAKEGAPAEAKPAAAKDGAPAEAKPAAAKDGGKVEAKSDGKSGGGDAGGTKPTSAAPTAKEAAS